MAPSAIDNTTVLADRTKDATSSPSDADPFILAVDQIRGAIIRHRTNKESLDEETSIAVDGIIEASPRSQSPVGFTNDAQTIEEIERILKELDRNHPPPKLSHDSSKIGADLISEDNRQVVEAPPRVEEGTWSIKEITNGRTHPESFEPYDHHIDKIITFENDLMKAFNNSKEAKVKYAKVEVLLLTWEAASDDDIREEVDADTRELVELFNEVNYTVTPCVIPRNPRKSWYHLQKQLSNFVDKYEDYENDDVLFLIHYNGHGSIRGRKSYWHPTAFAARRSDPYDPLSEKIGPTIEYDDVRKIFDSVINQDILFILDCCYAGAASRSKGPGNTKELLAACGSEDRTPADDSFTSRFVKCFRKQLETDPVFQVGWLFESITDVSQKPTPLHVNLNKSPTSICLSSLAAPEKLGLTASGLSNESLSVGLLDVEPSSATSSKALSTFSNDNDVSEANTRPTSIQGGPPFEVLITVKLHADVIPDKKGWHLEFPSNQVQGIKSVKVRSIASTKSTLLLVTMPIRCWILLPDNPAYTFIDFVKTDSYLNLPEAAPAPINSPSPAIGPVERSDSENSNKAPDHALPHIIAAIKEFFEKKDEAKEKTGPIRRISSKIGLHSSTSRLETDLRYGYIRHIMQQFVVIRNEHGESHVTYDLHYREEKKLFERCKKHLIKEVLDNAASYNKDQIENTVTAELDQLEREVLELDKKRPKIEPRVTSDSSKPSAKAHNKRTSGSHISKHEPIPEDQEVSGGNENISSVMSRTESLSSMKRPPRTDSMKSRNAASRSESRPLLSYLGRKLSRDSGRSSSPMASPMHSPSPGISTTA